MKRPKSANKIHNDDVKTFGGKEVVLNRLVNHYKAIANVKPKVIIEPPHPHVDAGKNKLKREEEYHKNHNVRETYKGVARVKAAVDTNKPFTFNMGRSIKMQSGKEVFEDFEHVRRLNAMSKRILSLGKPHERRKNKFDPIANPAYFFRKPGDNKAIQLVSLDKFSEKINAIVSMILIIFF